MAQQLPYMRGCFNKYAKASSRYFFLIDTPGFEIIQIDALFVV